MFLFRRRPIDLPEAVRAYLDAPRPDPDLPWRDVPYSVIDVETTGLNPRRDALLAIGLVDIDDGRIRMDQRWYTLVRPPDDAPVNPEAIRVHGLLPQDVEQAPPPGDVIPVLLRRLTGRVLVCMSPILTSASCVRRSDGCTRSIREVRPSTRRAWRGTSSATSGSSTAPTRNPRCNCARSPKAQGCRCMPNTMRSTTR